MGIPRPPDIADYLHIRTAAPAGFSTDARKLLIASNLPGTVQLFRHDRDSGKLDVVTSFDEPVAGRYLPGSNDVLLQFDRGGDERHQLAVIADDGTDLRQLTDDPRFIHWVGGIRRDGGGFAFQSNRRNGVDFDAFIHDLAAGRQTCVFDVGGWCSPADFSPDGSFLGVVRLGERSMDSDLFLVETPTGAVTHVSPHDDEAMFTGPSWFPDGSGFLFATDQGRQFMAIARYDMAARDWEYVLQESWDLRCDLDWSGTHALVVANVDGYSEARLVDPTTMSTVVDLPLPGRGVVGDWALSDDGRFVAYQFSSPTDHGDVWLYDTRQETTERVTTSPNAVPREAMVEPELHRFDSFDGRDIPVFLYRPRGVAGPCPLVVRIHGGPEGQSRATFDAVTQYLVACGYAVAVPNVRGSTGYGKAFHHLDDGRKRLDAVRDLAALHRWIADDGRLDEDRAALFGGSYGGCMVLAGLTMQPDLWAAGVDIVGISSLVSFLENTSPWRRAFREREYGSLERDRDFLVEASPLSHVDALRAPLFIIHGTNDPRVPLAEAEQIAAVLAAKGLRHELLVYPDEGHGLAKLANRLDAYPRVAAFLDEVLGP